MFSAITSSFKKVSAETTFFTVTILAVGALVLSIAAKRKKKRANVSPDLSEGETEKILGVFLKKLAEGATKFDQAFNGIKQQIASSGQSVMKQR